MSGVTKGWCPGALKPMMSGDGLIVRVRLTGGILSPEIARMLAKAALDHGNGLLDLTSRANLQMRGVREETLGPLLALLSELGLIDRDEASESVRNVMASPLAGIDPRAVDTRALTHELERRLTGDSAFHALPAKFGFAIDGGGALPIPVGEADIGLRAEEGGFRLLAAGRDRGHVDSERAVEEALALAAGFIRERRPDERRMRDFVKRLEDEARQTGFRHPRLSAAKGRGSRSLKPAHLPLDPLPSACGLAGDDVGSQMRLPSSSACERDRTRHLAGYYPLGESTGFVAAAATFGRMEARQLEGLAQAAAGRDLSLRLSPWRAILVGPVEGGAGLTDTLSLLGFVTDPADPRLAIAACPGSPSCLSGEAPAQDDAARLAPMLAPFVAEGATVHVSGCAKGCAHRGAASITLVGQGGRYALAIDADAKAPAVAGPMDVDEIAAFLAKKREGDAAKKSF